MKGRILKVQ
jgi:hypothetical protein